MKTSDTRVARALGVLVLVAAIGIGGCGGRSTSSTAATTASIGQLDMVAPEAAVPAAEAPAGGQAVSRDSKAVPSVSVESYASVQQYVISTAAMSIEVKDLTAGVEAVRKLAATHGGKIADLTLNAGGSSVPTPIALDEGSERVASTPTPGTARITLRIPSDKLAAAEKDATSLGRVLSQNASQDDVTQEHVDLAARLKNLRAEESRLRTFFLKAKRVSEMLAIEQELSRVRGEIESMQAQLDYLERQAAMATFTITLSEPGDVVSPGAGGWGFTAAVRSGVRAAATMTTGLITFILGISPLALLGILIWLVVRAVVRRGRRKRVAVETTAAPVTGDGEPGSGTEA